MNTFIFLLISVTEHRFNARHDGFKDSVYLVRHVVDHPGNRLLDIT